MISKWLLLPVMFGVSMTAALQTVHLAESSRMTVFGHFPEVLNQAIYTAFLRLVIPISPRSPEPNSKIAEGIGTVAIW